MESYISPSGPIYQHDCEACAFLYTYKNMDIYQMCGQGSHVPEGFLVRYSSEPSYYASMSNWTLDDALAYADRNAHMAGRMPDKDN
jgi:hypothetical protein